MQVRKVECVSNALAMAMEMPQQQQPMAANTSSLNANGQNLDYYLSDSVSGNNNNNNDDNDRRASIDANEMVQANGNEANRNRDGQAATANGQHLQCDPKTKPIATQPCTTGIECTPITLGTGNIDRGDAGQEERTKVDDTADMDGDDIETTDTNANVESETDAVGANGNAEVDEGEEDAEEMEELEEIEVFMGNVMVYR